MTKLNRLKNPSIFHKEKEEDLYKIGIYCIYFLHNPTKYYVGSTGIQNTNVKSSKGFWCRWRLHLWNLGKNQHHSKYLQNTYNKHGEDTIKFKILELVDNPNILIEREQFWINSLNAYKFGYNCTPIANSRLGVKTGNNLWGKAVVQYSLEGKKLGEYITAREAYRQTNMSYKVIHKCCIGKAIQYKNFIWRFKGDSFNKFRVLPIINVTKKVIQQYDKNGSFIAEYSSITEAHSHSKITLSNISMCLRDYRKSAGGFIWKQVNK